MERWIREIMDNHRIAVNLIQMLGDFHIRSLKFHNNTFTFSRIEQYIRSSGTHILLLSKFIGFFLLGQLFLQKIDTVDFYLVQLFFRASVEIESVEC